MKFSAERVRDILETLISAPKGFHPDRIIDPVEGLEEEIPLLILRHDDGETCVVMGDGIFECRVERPGLHNTLRGSTLDEWITIDRSPAGEPDILLFNGERFDPDEHVSWSWRHPCPKVW